MIPEGFEPLSFDDRVLVARINLVTAAIALLLSAFWLEASDWPIQTLPILGAAGLIYLARQLDTIIRRIGGPAEASKAEDNLSIHYLFPF